MQRGEWEEEERVIVSERYLNELTMIQNHIEHFFLAQL
jgi:hypothetical protein